MKELLVKLLEDAEFDIYHATNTEDVDNTRNKALADIHGGQVAGFITKAEAENWQKRIRDVATFRRASLEWRETP